MMEKSKVFKLVSFIPQGKVLTYGQIAKFLGIKSARVVGQILHQNPDPKNIPCHRVVFNDGSLAKSYAFGGKKEQWRKLKDEGITFYHLESDRHKMVRVDFKKHLWRPSKILKIYFQLLQKFGEPGPWPWFNQGPPATKEEIVIGAILTQNTNWDNVEKALNNLRKNKANNLQTIYQLGKKDLEFLKKLIRPSGFYNQKGERLFGLTKFIIENYKSLDNFFKLSIKKARNLLLSLKGIGEETADTILLYAGEKPIFVIDAYTKRFLEKYFSKELSFFDRTKMASYQNLQKFFMDNLPRPSRRAGLPADVKLFQDYHALIVRWGKEN